MLTELEFKEKLEMEGFNLPRRFILESREDFRGSFPAVVKVSSERITHKTEAGAVITDVRSVEELGAAISRLKTRFPGEVIYAEEMVPKGIEVMIGLTSDSLFGKIMLFGLGGFYAELLRDVTFKRVPIDIYDAEDMIDELKFSEVFRGYRKLSANRNVVTNLLLKVSDFGSRTEFSQIDFNPVFLYEDSYVIVDAKIFP
ncbi:MAG: acetate--CoA ligase family protein [Thermoplasmata archaeon]